VCFTGVVLNLKREPLQVDEIVKEAYVNPHGFFLYSRDPPTIMRTIDLHAYLFTFTKVAMERPRYLHFHMRLASTGALTLDNVHGWKVCGFYITHNGIVSAFSDLTGQQYYSDTYTLITQPAFQEHLRKRDWPSLYRFMAEKGFWGVMFLVSEDFKEVYAISRRKAVYFKKLHGVVYVTSKRVFKKSKRASDGVFKVTYESLKPLYTETPMSMSIEQDDDLGGLDLWLPPLVRRCFS
jgi:hypothetical protein